MGVVLGGMNLGFIVASLGGSLQSADFILGADPQNPLEIGQLEDPTSAQF